VTIAERYLVLGLRLGRHVDGLVDAYYGPARLKEEVDGEELVPAGRLVADAERLLGEVDDEWLGDQLRGLHTYARVLAGEELTFREEVEGCFGVSVEEPKPDAYEEAHARLDELLAGDGSLAERREEFRRSQYVPGERLLPALRDVVAELRARTPALAELPEGESIDLDEVKDEPWLAFNYYLGDFASRVVVNTDLPLWSDDLIELAAHECYPGHHTERALKERALVREAGLLEESIQLTPTPQSLLAEGIAESGRGILLDEEGEAALTSILRRHGIEWDERSPAVRAAAAPLRRVGIDLALLLHEGGASEADAEAYSRRWALATPEQARHHVRFVADRTWRAYVVTYSAGGELVRRYTGGDPGRFRRLLTEHVRIADLT
jgi:hypothetical protein